MKKILLFSLSIFAGNVLASESNTINFKYSMDTGNYPLSLAVNKLSDSLYETASKPKIEFITDHALTIVTVKPDASEEPDTSEEPFVGMIVCDKQGNYFMLTLPFDYDRADKEKNEKNLETAQIPLKVEKQGEKSMVYAPQKQYSLLRLSTGALALFGGYELIKKIVQLYRKQATKNKDKPIA